MAAVEPKQLVVSIPVSRDMVEQMPDEWLIQRLGRIALEGLREQVK